MKNILIADDDYSIAATLSTLLEDAGYHTCTVSSGTDAIEKVRDEDFDVVLLDMMMPGMNGIDALPELRRLNPKTQVIMITGFPSFEDAVEAVKKGACDYITKPIKKETLFQKVGRAAENAAFEKYLNRLDVNAVMHSLSNFTRRSILKLISPCAGMRLTEIKKALKIDDHTKVVFHLKLLREAGLIEQKKDKSYVLTPEGRKVLDCLGIMQNYLSE